MLHLVYLLGEKRRLYVILALLPLVLTVMSGAPSANAGPEFRRARNCGLIQQRINALPPTGGTALLRRGVYICEEPILIDRDNVTLLGEGPATILRSANGANAPVIIIGQTAAAPTITRSHIRVSNLTIDGNRENQTYECWGGDCETGGLTHIRNNGITIRRAADVIIDHVTVFGAKSGGLVTEKDCQRINVHDFTAYDNEFDGLAGYETHDSQFSNLFLHNNAAAGLSFDWDFNHNIISDAVIAGNGTVGIFMQDSEANIFDNIQIRGAVQHGIFLAAANNDANRAAANNTFTGLVISNWGSAGFCVDEFIGVGVCVNNESASNNLLVGAQLIGDSETCIKEASPGLLQTFATICH